MKDCLKLKRYNEFKEFNKMISTEEKTVEETYKKVNYMEKEETFDETLCLSITEVTDKSYKKESENLKGLVETLRKIMATTIEKQFAVQKMIKLSDLCDELQKYNFNVTENFRKAILINSLVTNYPELVLKLENTSLNWIETKEEVKQQLRRIKKKNGKSKKKRNGSTVDEQL